MLPDVGSLLRALGIQGPAATSAAVTLGGGDVAQVASLPAGVAAAFGINVTSEGVTRREAMSIPAVRRGRAVIAGTIARFPLVSTRIQTSTPGQPAPAVPGRTLIRRTLLEQPDPELTAGQWKTRVVDDLIFYPYSWGRVLERDGAGWPTRIGHMRMQDLRLDFAGQRLYYKGVEVQLADVVRFDAPDEGLLVHGATVLRTALKLEAAVRRYADMDVPLGVLRREATTADRLDKTKIDELLERWADGARKRTTRYIGSLKYESVQLDAQRIQLAEARQRSDTAIAQLLNLESGQVNAPSESGMTYTNRESIAASRIDALGPYMDAIAERLSLPDITPPGEAVTFDTTRYLRGTTKEVLDAAAIAVGNRPLMDVDEARARFLDLPPSTALQEQP